MLPLPVVVYQEECNAYGRIQWKIRIDPELQISAIPVEQLYTKHSLIQPIRGLTPHDQALYAPMWISSG